MKPIIEISKLSKCYRIGADKQKYLTLREELARSARGVLRRFLSRHRHLPKDEEYWALKDVSFTVEQGEAVGIVGRNGAGKSTLLKILSKITPPTRGQITLRGRIASLLEVGTGFHPELTGRENIFLNGAILGMTRAEIKKKFDEIVAFAEVEKFLDTPVKRYSSGMYVRLAFAVAAHLEPEILVVDEVLAVGDAEFQKKCLGKMEEVSKGGRTVLFVSHNIQAVKLLCSRCVILKSGTVVGSGVTEAVLSGYFIPSNKLSGEKAWLPELAPGDDSVKLLKIRTRSEKGGVGSNFLSNDQIFVDLEFLVSHSNASLKVGFELIGDDGAVVFTTHHNDREESNWPLILPGVNKLSCAIPGGLLNKRTYRLAPRISLHCRKWIVHTEPVIEFTVITNHGANNLWVGDATQPGLIRPILAWRVIP